VVEDLIKNGQTVNSPILDFSKLHPAGRSISCPVEGTLGERTVCNDLIFRTCSGTTVLLATMNTTARQKHRERILRTALVAFVMGSFQKMLSCKAFRNFSIEKKTRTLSLRKPG
jgi:hypothetical protein